MKMNKAYYLKKLLVDIVYPNRCPFCDEIIPFNEYYHGKCAEVLDNFDFNKSKDNICSVCLYNDNSKSFVFAAKENGSGYAVSAASRMLYERLSEQNLLKDIDVITSIPAKKASLNKRGYCFPALMAREIGEIAKIPFYGKILINRNLDIQQKELSAESRAENAKKMFSAGKVNIEGLKILLIDDVCVTGVTLGAGDRVLKGAGAGDTVKAAFARTVTNPFAPINKKADLTSGQL